MLLTLQEDWLPNRLIWVGDNAWQISSSKW